MANFAGYLIYDCSSPLCRVETPSSTSRVESLNLSSLIPSYWFVLNCWLLQGLPVSSSPLCRVESLSPPLLSCFWGPLYTLYKVEPGPGPYFYRYRLHSHCSVPIGTGTPVTRRYRLPLVPWHHWYCSFTYHRYRHPRYSIGTFTLGIDHHRYRHPVLTLVLTTIGTVFTLVDILGCCFTPVSSWEPLLHVFCVQTSPGYLVSCSSYTNLVAWVVDLLQSSLCQVESPSSTPINLGLYPGLLTCDSHPCVELHHSHQTSVELTDSPLRLGCVTVYWVPSSPGSTLWVCRVRL